MEESIKIEEAIAKALKLEAVDPRTYSPLVLAYIGDAVYELLIRTKVINHGSMQVNKMHKKSASLVKAETQANIIKAIQDDLTEEELENLMRPEHYTGLAEHFVDQVAGTA